MNHKAIGKVGFILLFFWTKNIIAQYQVEKLGPQINSSLYDEISPVVTRDGRTLYFTRIGTPEFNRTLIQEEIDLSKTLNDSDYFQMLKSVYSQIAERDIDNPIQSTINQDIWIADSKEGLFDRVFHPGFPINNALPNSVCSLSEGDHTLVIINHFARDGSMYKGFSFIDRKEDGSFSFPDPMYINDFHSMSTDVNLSMSKDGDVIILSMNRAEGLGDNDLYVSFKLKRNLWSEPINLGRQVNSIHRELTPYISEDKSKLYFSSNRPGGIGGTDIYVANRLDYTWKEWSTPELLPEPINSTSDDSNPVVVEPNDMMYFISRRDGTSDIFKTELLRVSVINQPITLRGTVRHSITNEVLSSELFYGSSRLPINNHEVQSLPNGVFEIKLDRPDVYKISPRKAGYIGKNQLVDVNMLVQSNILTYEIDFFLTPMDVEQKIEIGNIYFEKGKSIVLAQSFPEIDRLADILIQNPSIGIRIDGHTDNVGIFNELLDLSRDRAESIKKYLVIQKGIGSHRIGTVGYGGSRPISPNDSEGNRAKNRRVEIFVTTSSNVQRKVKIQDLKDPLIKPIAEGIEATTEPQNTKSNPMNSALLISAEKQVEVPALPKLKHYGNIQFNINELSVKETSMLELRKLIDYLMSKPDIKIILQGMCTDNEIAPNQEIRALQRAKGIKEYLIFKSIKADRITLQENSNDKTFPGVKVYVIN